MGGFICPYTVPTAAFWKLGQSKPGDTYRFKLVSNGGGAGAAPQARPPRLRRHHRLTVTDRERPMAHDVQIQIPGNVWKVLVKPGDQVKSGDVLFILEVMKTEVPHHAEADGTVKAVHLTEGQVGRRRRWRRGRDRIGPSTIPARRHGVVGGYPQGSLTGRRGLRCRTGRCGGARPGIPQGQRRGSGTRRRGEPGRASRTRPRARCRG